MAVEDVEPVAEKADILQIGARNMQNFTLLSEVGKTQRPVMLKRGMSSSIDELLQAAEYILAEGNQQVFLCERGIRTFETATRSTLDISAIPVLKERPHLPVIIDPSHAAGERDLVPPLAIASKAVGAHGIMVEFIQSRKKHLVTPQALLFHQFEKLMSDFIFVSYAGNTVNLRHTNHKIVIGSNLLGNVSDILSDINYSTIAVITDQNVSKHWLDSLDVKPIASIYIGTGEENKTLGSVKLSIVN